MSEAIYSGPEVGVNVGGAERVQMDANTFWYWKLQAPTYVRAGLVGSDLHVFGSTTIDTDFEGRSENSFVQRSDLQIFNLGVRFDERVGFGRPGHSTSARMHRDPA